MRVFLLGASGAAGRRTAAELLRQPEVDELVLSGRDADAIANLERSMGAGSDRVRSFSSDVRDERLVSHLRGADVVVSCAGPSYETEMPAVQAALAAGVSFVSLCDEHVPFEGVHGLQDRARDAGITIVSGCGLSPGITNLLVAYATRELDSVDAVDISLARSSTESTGLASARHFLYELSVDAIALEDRQRVTERAGTGPKLVYFPEPVGWVETFFCGHPEVVTLPRTHPSIEAIEFRIGLIERITMDTARAFSATPAAASDTARRAFVKLTRPLRPLIDRLPPTGPPWTAARVDTHGLRNGTPATISLGVVDRLLNFASIPLTLAALRLGDESTATTGVLPPEEAFDVPTFLRDLTQRGISIARLEPRPV
ncbi:MAG: saccharopine dehydrogenase NADP-binding domain-containing protein [Actinomycetota bacterium]|nr:saccharopine dehydrogenase NADP-binding domain-containing protein [Actinomycetota bacterium]